ncbi:MAG: reverse transcriptase family protein, partial [Lentilactobacillus hilgardii]
TPHMTIQEFCSFTLTHFLGQSNAHISFRSHLHKFITSNIATPAALHEFIQTWKIQHFYLAWISDPCIIDFVIRHGPFSQFIHREFLEHLGNQATNLSHLFILISQTPNRRFFLHSPTIPPIVQNYNIKSTTTHLGTDLEYYLVYFTDDPDQKPLECLADTGAQHSLITADLVQTYGFSTYSHIDHEYVEMKVLGHSAIVSARFINVEFAIGDHTYSQEFLVSDQASNSCILGLDFIKLHRNTLPPPSSHTAHQNQSFLNTLFARYLTTDISFPPSRHDDYKFQFTASLDSLPPGYHIQYSQAHFSFLKEEIQRLLSLKWITATHSVPFYTVPFVTVGKKLRMVLDYRKLNSITLPLPSTIPSIESLLVGLHGRVFSALDLSSAYHHLRLHPTTAFATTFRFANRFYHWNVLPFGLTNAPEIFSRFLSSLFESLSTNVRVYLDDILIVSENENEHKQHLEQVLKILYQHELHLNVDKSHFFQDTVEWVGHSLTTSSD